jgi:hypothetical protein
VREADSKAKILHVFRSWATFLEDPQPRAPSKSPVEPQSKPPQEDIFGDLDTITTEEVCERLGCHYGALKAFTRPDRKWLVRVGTKQYARASFESNLTNMKQYLAEQLVEKRKYGGGAP